MPPLPNTPVAVVDGGTNLTKSSDIVQVICAFPLSGQYGPGSRWLYYVLVAVCILARKAQWVRNACLAAALVSPAIAAVHAITLAGKHVDGAVDLDIYGALQFCAIGVLAGPTTVRFSKTYFENNGLGLLFVWSLVILAGLLALAVEFFRTEPVPCVDDGSGQPIFSTSEFPYGNTTCGLTCSAEMGPWSPLRAGPASEIFVIPYPDIFPFGAATLVAVTCCIPGVLYLVWTWMKLFAANSPKALDLSDARTAVVRINTTSKKMTMFMKIVDIVFGRVDLLVFGCAVAALIIFGEYNFSSDPMRWETEPLSNASQWSGLVGAVFAVVGTLYVLVADHIARDAAQPSDASVQPTHDGPDHSTAITHTPMPCNCQHVEGSSTNTRPSSLHSHHKTQDTQRHHHLKSICYFPMVRPESRETQTPKMVPVGEEELGSARNHGRLSRANSFSSVLSQLSFITSTSKPHSLRPLPSPPTSRPLTPAPGLSVVSQEPASKLTTFPREMSAESHMGEHPGGAVVTPPSIVVSFEADEPGATWTEGTSANTSPTSGDAERTKGK